LAALESAKNGEGYGDGNEGLGEHGFAPCQQRVLGAPHRLVRSKRSAGYRKRHLIGYVFPRILDMQVAKLGARLVEGAPVKLIPINAPASCRT
jgi:hypothetical protein